MNAAREPESVAKDDNGVTPPMSAPRVSWPVPAFTVRPNAPFAVPLRFKFPPPAPVESVVLLVKLTVPRST